MAGVLDNLTGSIALTVAPPTGVGMNIAGEIAQTINSQPTPTGGSDPSTPTGPTEAELYAQMLAAQLEAQRQSAYSTLYATFKKWGIDVDGSGLAAQVHDWIWQDKSAEEVGILIVDTKAYNDRFTGMADLIKRGQKISEADYIGLEKQYHDVMQSWNIPTTFYDDYKDYGRLIANGVSVKEVDDRVKSAKTFLDTEAPSTYKSALRELGIDESGMLAYVLDGDRAQSIITGQMKQAAIMGAANQYGFDLNAAEGAKYAATLGDDFNAIGADQRASLEATLSKLGVTAANDERLSYIDQEAFQREDTLDASLLNDTSKGLASQRRALREKARFSGSSAVTTGSLSRNTGV